MERDLSGVIYDKKVHEAEKQAIQNSCQTCDGSECWALRKQFKKNSVYIPPK